MDWRIETKCIQSGYTPENGQPVAASDMFRMQATSAETNVASISAYLGLPVKVLTTFVKDSPIAQFIKSNLRSRFMEFEGKKAIAGGTTANIISRELNIPVFADMSVPAGKLPSLSKMQGVDLVTEGIRKF